QANLWTEYITTTEKAEYMVLPRMLALAEVVWSPKQNRDWKNFSERLVSHFKAFEQKGYHYCPGNFTVNIKPVSESGKLSVTLTNEILNSDIYYTVEGSIPTLQSIKYSEPIKVESSATVKAVTVLNGVVMGLKPNELNFVFHKAIGKTVTYTNPVSNYYKAEGSNSLTDGIRGTYSVGKYWHGFSEKDFVATVDLGAITSIQNITIGCLQKYKDWIFLPQWVEFEVSKDGVSFTEIQTLQNPVSINEKENIHDFKISFTPLQVRYVRITGKNNLCPPGHSGEGKPGWIFADEIIVQ
ncbi:MAG TPA: FN3 associated domain-containing protein, partial [Panacibacter sp.]|nr:FN3 associated domain-containing protein [Panacibacter sp.]